MRINTLENQRIGTVAELKEAFLDAYESQSEYCKERDIKTAQSFNDAVAQYAENSLDWETVFPIPDITETETWRQELRAASECG